MPAAAHSLVDHERIVATESVIRPHIRSTPVVEVDGAELDLPQVRLSLKLELL